MKLTLDHTQRLNLHSIIGNQRGTVDDIRLCWRIQDQITLSAEEKTQISFRIEQSNGNQIASWDLAKTSPADFEFAAEEYARIAKAIKGWEPGFAVGGDRLWLEPLLGQLENGQPQTEKPKP